MMTVDVSVSTKSGIRQVHANVMKLLKHKLSSLFWLSNINEVNDIEEKSTSWIIAAFD